MSRKSITRVLRRQRESGTILILSMIVIFAMASIGFSLAQTVATQYTSQKQRLYAENATTAAEAGVSAAIAQLNKNPDFTNFSSPQAFYSNSDQGYATYEVTITNGTNNQKAIVSTGKTYKTTDNSQLANTKKVRAVAGLKREIITNSLIFGSGGLTMLQNAGLPRGDIYIRGQLRMEQNAFIGSTTESTNLSLANVGCDPVASWPQPCGAASPPVRMVNSTPGSIYGTVCATNQTQDSYIYPGPTGSGLIDDCESRITAAPTFNKKAFVESIGSSGVPASTYQCPFFGGSVIIPANIRLTGDLVLSSGIGTCTVYITGNIYITGKLEIGTASGSNVIVRIADSVGTVKPIIVANREIGVRFITNGSNPVRRNSSGTPGFFISFWATNNSCSLSETIPSDTVQTCLTPAEAKASATPSVTTMSNGASSYTFDFTGMIYYAYYATFSISGTNVTVVLYAIGAQGGGMDRNTRFDTVATDAPFGDILAIPTYKVVDYRQSYE